MTSRQGHGRGGGLSTAFWVATGGLVALFVLGEGARWGLRLPWWLEAVAIGHGLLGLAVLACAGAAALSRSWVAAAGLVAVWALAAAPWGGGGAGEREDIFQILSLNAGGRALAFETSERIRALADQRGIEVIAWQEHDIRYPDDASYGSASTLQPIVRGGLYTSPRPVDSLGRPPRGIVHLANPVLTVLPWVRQSQPRLASDLPEHEQSPYTRAVLEWDGREIAVYNVHLASYPGERPWRDDIGGGLRGWGRFLRTIGPTAARRAAEARALRDVLGREPRPFLVVGDLNSAPGQEAYEILSDGLTDVLETAGSWPGFTFHARIPFVRIDHVLASPHWEVVDADVLGDLSSDHRAVVASLRLRSVSSPQARSPSD